MATTILIVEDHPATFLGLRAYIGALEEYEDLGAVTSGEDALVRARELAPQLVCLDLALAGELDGFEVCEQLSALPDPPRVVVYTGQEEPGIVTRARQAGALAVVAKSERHSEFGRALSLAAAGKPYTSPVFARAVAVRELTDRQRRVLELMALGLDNRADRRADAAGHRDDQDARAGGPEEARGQRSHPCRGNWVARPLHRMSVRIALIGEHQFTLLGLAWRVKRAPQMEMAGMLARSDGVVERAKRAGAQAAVLDIPRADEPQALDVCRALADAGVAVVAYCESQAPGTVERALQAGALGVVSKSEDTAEVLRAGQVVVHGKQHVSPGMQSAAGPVESAEVTPRQRELLQLMADGLGTEDAARALGVSPETVKTHVEGLMAKLGASGRTEAVAIALRRGIIR